MAKNVEIKIEVKDFGFFKIGQLQRSIEELGKSVNESLDFSKIAAINPVLQSIAVNIDTIKVLFQSSVNEAVEQAVVTVNTNLDYLVENSVKRGRFVFSAFAVGLAAVGLVAKDIASGWVGVVKEFATLPINTAVVGAFNAALTSIKAIWPMLTKIENSLLSINVLAGLSDSFLVKAVASASKIGSILVTQIKSGLSSIATLLTLDNMAWTTTLALVTDINKAILAMGSGLKAFSAQIFSVKYFTEVTPGYFKGILDVIQRVRTEGARLNDVFLVTANSVGIIAHVFVTRFFLGETIKLAKRLLLISQEAASPLQRASSLVVTIEKSTHETNRIVGDIVKTVAFGIATFVGPFAGIVAGIPFINAAVDTLNQAILRIRLRIYAVFGSARAQVQVIIFDLKRLLFAALPLAISLLPVIKNMVKLQEQSGKASKSFLKMGESASPAIRALAKARMPLGEQIQGIQLKFTVFFTELLNRLAQVVNLLIAAFKLTNTQLAEVDAKTRQMGGKLDQSIKNTSKSFDVLTDKTSIWLRMWYGVGNLITGTVVLPFKAIGYALEGVWVVLTRTTDLIATGLVFGFKGAWFAAKKFGELAIVIGLSWWKALEMVSKGLIWAFSTGFQKARGFFESFTSFFVKGWGVVAGLWGKLFAKTPKIAIPPVPAKAPATSAKMPTTGAGMTADDWIKFYKWRDAAEQEALKKTKTAAAAEIVIRKQTADPALYKNVEQLVSRNINLTLQQILVYIRLKQTMDLLSLSYLQLGKVIAVSTQGFDKLAIKLSGLGVASGVINTLQGDTKKVGSVLDLLGASLTKTGKITVQYVAALQTLANVGYNISHTFVNNTVQMEAFASTLKSVLQVAKSVKPVFLEQKGFQIVPQGGKSAIVDFGIALENLRKTWAAYTQIIPELKLAGVKGDVVSFNELLRLVNNTIQTTIENFKMLAATTGIPIRPIKELADSLSKDKLEFQALRRATEDFIVSVGKLFTIKTPKIVLPTFEPKGYKQSGEQIDKYLAEGMKAGKAIVKRSAIEVAEAAAGAFPRSLPIFGPLVKLPLMGYKIPMYLAQGIRSGLKLVTSAAISIAEAFTAPVERMMNMGKLAVQTGVGIEKISLLDKALESLGASAGESTFVFTKLQKLVRGLATEEETEGLRELGINLGEVQKTADPVLTLFFELITAINGANNGSRNFNQSLELMGLTASSAMIPAFKRGVPEIKAAVKQFSILGGVITEENYRAAQAFTSLKAIFGSVKEIMVREFITPIIFAFKGLSDRILAVGYPVRTMIQSVVRRVANFVAYLIDTITIVVDFASQKPDEFTKIVFTFLSKIRGLLFTMARRIASEVVTLLSPVISVLFETASALFKAFTGTIFGQLKTQIALNINLIIADTYASISGALRYITGLIADFFKWFGDTLKNLPNTLWQIITVIIPKLVIATFGLINSYFGEEIDKFLKKIEGSGLAKILDKIGIPITQLRIGLAAFSSEAGKSGDAVRKTFDEIAIDLNKIGGSITRPMFDVQKERERLLKEIQDNPIKINVAVDEAIKVAQEKMGKLIDVFKTAGESGKIAFKDLNIEVQKTMAEIADVAAKTIGDETGNRIKAAYDKMIEVNRKAQETIKGTNQAAADSIVNSNVNKGKKIADAEAEDYRRRRENAKEWAFSQVDQMVTLFSTLQDISKKKHKALFVAEKGFTIAKMIMDGAAGIVRGFKDLPTPLAYINVGIITALVAAQIAKVVGLKFVKGGKVDGPGGQDRVPAMLTAGEYVIPKPAVDWYGIDVMQAIRSRLIPRASILDELDFRPVMEMPKTHYQDGGSVKPIQTQPATQQTQEINIVNVVDQGVFDRFAASSRGRRAILNVVTEYMGRR